MTITIPASELFDEENDEFLYTKEQTLVLEHSLVSISKWETKWKKPYLSETPKSDEEALDYIRCMTITQNVLSLSRLTDGACSANSPCIKVAGL